MKRKIFKKIIAGIIAFTMCNTIIFASEQSTKLPTIKIYDDFNSSNLNVEYITPDGGVDLEAAKILIDKYVVDNGNSYIHTDRLIEITTKELWDNANIQIFTDHWDNYIAFISNNKVMDLLTFYDGFNSIHEIYLSDINSDNLYDICVNVSVGSGWVDKRIGVFDIQNRKSYELQIRDLGHYKMELNNETNRLNVRKELFGVSGATQLGELIIADGILTTTDILATIDENTLPFTIDRVSIVKSNENTIPKGDEEFLVRIDISKYKKRDGEDYVALAVYDENGELLNLYYEKYEFKIDGGFSFGFDVNPTELSKPIASIKAFVFDDFNTLEPLAESVEFR